MHVDISVREALITTLTQDFYNLFKVIYLKNVIEKSNSPVVLFWRNDHFRPFISWQQIVSIGSIKARPRIEVELKFISFKLANGIFQPNEYQANLCNINYVTCVWHLTCQSSQFMSLNKGALWKGYRGCKLMSHLYLVKVWFSTFLNKNPNTNLKENLWWNNFIRGRTYTHPMCINFD